MKITYYRGKHPNFGDGLNLWLWPRLLPNFFDSDESILFLGIGSIIGNQYGTKAKKIVFGAGFVPNYFDKPDVSGKDWDIFFVRGPRTAEALHISKHLAIGDAAILLRTVVDYSQRNPTKISFIPHWQSLDIGNWEKVCSIAGVDFVDPRRPVEDVIEALLGSKLVISEAMHGAIVADALRVPWVPVMPIHSLHRGKWFDWAETLGIDLRPYRLWPSTLEEANHALTHRSVLAVLKRGVSAVPLLSSMADNAIAHIAAHRIRQTDREDAGP